ncbi:hypothetical protein MERGE_002212 [Pneumocystis wakefieldiae]|uniref:Uncharacterized protein n=1 Tax=Pneumocystis wakefieldiae TaxID=38082 RepID=A0A899G0N8_9ASCO|nr:hypothetical protein MERGE_002212 [Pneumocystis wakefieldiae]
MIRLINNKKSSLFSKIHLYPRYFVNHNLSGLFIRNIQTEVISKKEASNPQLTCYLFSPLFNWHLDSETISSILHTWPAQAKVLAKFIVSFPFTYHSFNGLRHLYWDTGRGLTLKGVYTTGYIVIEL